MASPHAENAERFSMTMRHIRDAPSVASNSSELRWGQRSEVLTSSIDRPGDTGDFLFAENWLIVKQLCKCMHRLSSNAVQIYRSNM